MRLTHVAGAVLAVLVLTGSAAALPANAPVQATDDAADEADGAATTDADSADARADRTTRGPPSDLPAAVPDFVGDVHDAIGRSLAGDGEGSLGGTISDLTPDDDSQATDDRAGDAADGADDAAAETDA